MGDASPALRGTAKVYLATVYLKHRSLQSRKATYRGWHLPSAGKSSALAEDSNIQVGVQAPVNGSSNYNCSMVEFERKLRCYSEVCPAKWGEPSVMCV